MSQKLQKNIGLAAALSTVIGMVIGGGVFFKPSAVYTLTGGAPGLGILSWVLAGVLTITAGLTAAEVSAAIPKTGGMMVYIEEIYGKKLGALTGWMQSSLFFPATIAALAVMFANQTIALLGLNANLSMPITIGTILFIAILNTLGSKTSGAIQTVSTIGKLVPLAILIIFGFVKGEGSNPIVTPLVASDVSPFAIIGQVLIAILFAYDGWINVGALAGEMKNPGKDLPKAIVGGLSAVMAVYLIINVAYLWVLPANELTVANPAAAIAAKLFGDMGGKIVTAGILISVFGCANGYLLTGPRVLYTLGQQKSIPGYKTISVLNKNNVPANATLIMAVLASLYALSGQFDLLTDLSMFAIWSFYVLTFIGVIKLRKSQPDLYRPYKVPMYPVIPCIAIAGGLFVVLNQLLFAGMTNTIISLAGVVVTLIGLPLYNLAQKQVAKEEGSNSTEKKTA
ncbi:MAG: APC family permease [Terrisporobacter sp.]|uniref:APC family permease n=1 Tax=Terrisporobacter sp. TaxID=1965305 RepID=UPI0025D32A9A|nr:amino acid permease [uncultured Terrisporobacter sp.]